jgi:hypothetical protein
VSWPLGGELRACRDRPDGGWHVARWPTSSTRSTNATRLNPQKARNKAVRQLEAMGYHVTLDQAS